MHRTITTHLILWSLCLLIANRGQAEGHTCLPPQDLSAALERSYSEVPLATALMPDGALMTLYTSQRGSWTMTLQTAGSNACIVAAGQDFNLLHRGGLIPDRAT